MWLNEIKPAERDVYVSDYTCRGKRHCWAINSRGERIALRVVPADAPESSYRKALDDLWVILDLLDPPEYPGA